MLLEAVESLNSLYERYPFMAAMLLPLIFHLAFFQLEIGYFQNLSRTRFATAFIGLSVLTSILAGILLFFFGSPMEYLERVIFFFSFPLPLAIAARLAAESGQRAKLERKSQ